MGFLMISTQKAIGQGIDILHETLGEIMTGKSGSLNLGIPSVMYTDSIAGLIRAFLYENRTASPSGLAELLVSLVCAFVYAALRGLVYSAPTITLRVNQSVTGLTLTTFGVDFGNFFGGPLAKLAESVGQIPAAVTGTAYKTPVPRLSELGVIGQIFFSYGPPTYLTVVLTLTLALFLVGTGRELNLRAVDESPVTADAAGINVTAYKYLAAYLGGGIGGLGGLHFVMEYSDGTRINNGFGDRGWLATTLIIFALWKPVNAIWDSILFGGLYVLYLYTPGLDGGAQEIFKVFPCVVAIVALIITSLRKRGGY